MIELAIGRPGTGKSMYNAKTTLELLERSVRIEKKYGFERKIYVNFHLSDKIQKKYNNKIRYYTDLLDLVTVTDCDIVIDEISSYLPSDKWKDTHFEVRRMFAQHRKRGIEIYANTQAYKSVDINFRRMIQKVWSMSKLFGSRDPSSTLPPIKNIWGIIMMRELDPVLLEDEAEKTNMGLFPSFFWISRKLVEIYNTREDIKPTAPPPLVHIERECLVATCRHVRVVHY